MIVYKHLKSDFADSFASGRGIRLGSLASYRASEGERGDRLEGVVEYVVPSVSLDNANNPRFESVRQKLSEGPIPIPWGGQNVIVANNTFRIVLPTTYIFCASAEPDFSRVDKGEAIFRISEIQRFARRLMRRSNGVLSAPKFGPVDYEVRSCNPFDYGLLKEGAFQKSIDLEWENEIRIVWEALRDVGPEIFIDAPWVSDLIERIA